jgi:hypothetical protein
MVAPCSCTRTDFWFAPRAASVEGPTALVVFHKAPLGFWLRRQERHDFLSDSVALEGVHWARIAFSERRSHRAVVGSPLLIGGCIGCAGWEIDCPLNRDGPSAQFYADQEVVGDWIGLLPSGKREWDCQDEDCCETAKLVQLKPPL